MRAHARVRYITSKLHYLVYPETKKFVKADNDCMPSKFNPYFLYFLNKRFGTNHELLDLLTLIMNGEEIAVGANTCITYLSDSEKEDVSETPLCAIIKDCDKEFDDKYILELLADPELDVNLIGCDDWMTPLECIVDQYSYGDFHVDYALKWFPKLMQRGAVMALREKYRTPILIKYAEEEYKKKLSLISTFIGLCVKR